MLFEKAKWITRHPWTPWRIRTPENDEPSPYLIRDLTVEKPLQKALLYVAGYGQGAYFVNGKRIPDAELPTQRTDPMRTVVYNAYDITALLHPGKNRVGAWLGKHLWGYSGNYFRSYVKMIAQLDLAYADGETAQIVSDTSWRTADSPLVKDTWRGGETYDASREIPGWCDPNTPCDDWEPAKLCKGPGGQYREILSPRIKRIREIPGKEIAPGLFDFGTNTAGWVRLQVIAPAGEEILIRYAERLTEDGMQVDQSSISQGQEHRHEEHYFAKGDAAGEEWEPCMMYHGFRYAQVLGNYATARLTAVVVHADLPSRATFTCDNEILNKIHAACLNSILTNCHTVITDCPHREQMPWTGDGMASAESINMNFAAYGFFHEWMLHFKDNQGADGQLSSIIPGDSNWSHNFACGPDWDSAIIHIPYYMYKYSGNREIVDLMWDNMTRTLHHFSMLSEGYLLDYGLGDWTAFDPEDEDTPRQTCPREITDTCYYRLDSLMLAEMAEATGRDPAPWQELAEAIRQAFREKYLPDGSLSILSDTALAISLYAGMYTPEEEPAEAARLARLITDRGYRIGCGIHGVRTLFDVLSRHGYDQVIFNTLTNSRARGYAQVVTSGLDTLPEGLHWTLPQRRHASLNHHFFSHVDTWFYKALAGIRLEGFGYGNVVIEPKFVDGVTRLSAALGGIRVEYDPDAIRVSSPHPFTLRLGGHRDPLCRRRVYHPTAMKQRKDYADPPPALVRVPGAGLFSAGVGADSYPFRCRFCRSKTGGETPPLRCRRRYIP